MIGTRGGRSTCDFAQNAEREFIAITARGTTGTAIINSVAQVISAWYYGNVSGYLLETYAAIAQARKQNPDAFIILTIANTRASNDLALDSEKQYMTIWSSPIWISIKDSVANSVAARNNGWLVRYLGQSHSHGSLIA